MDDSNDTNGPNEADEASGTDHARDDDERFELSRGVDSDERERISLCEVLDRVLHRGVLVRGELVISIADVDLLYLGLQVVLASTDTAIKAGLVAPRRRWVLNPPMIRD